MLEDNANNVTLTPLYLDADSVESLVRKRQPDYFSFADWQRLDNIEVARGQSQGRPRVKFTSVNEMLAALGRALPKE